jgi:hypothetical protein
MNSGQHSMKVIMTTAAQSNQFAIPQTMQAWVLDDPG